MPRMLIAYASTHGHTARIAVRLAEAARSEGLEVDLHDLASGDGPDVHDHDVIVVGGSIHAGHHQRAVVDYVKRRAIALTARPSALFSVSLTAADATEEARAATRAYIDDLLDDTGWRPWITTSFAGALQYREYDFMTRLLIRLMMARGHHPTDTSQDYDYTDWGAVDAFARSCVGLIPAAVTARAAG